jgi:hypothetical protein
MAAVVHRHASRGRYQRGRGRGKEAPIPADGDHLAPVGPPGRQAPADAGLRRWATTLSFPSVEVLVLDDHVVVRADGELLASGSLAPPATGS